MSASTPLGIAKLISLSGVSVRQKTTVFSGNKYVVMEPGGDEPLLRAEEAGGLNLLIGKDRSFEITLYDTQEKPVIKLRRPYTFGPDKMKVSVCERLVSVVRQEMTLMKPVFNINDPSDQRVLRVKGPAITEGESDFEIFDMKKNRIGVIQKKWGGFMREVLTDSDSFQISFPQDLAVEYKVAIIGTCFLIDFLYYER